MREGSDVLTLPECLPLATRSIRLSGPTSREPVGEIAKSLRHVSHRCQTAYEGSQRCGRERGLVGHRKVSQGVSFATIPRRFQAPFHGTFRRGRWLLSATVSWKRGIAVPSLPDWFPGCGGTQMREASLQGFRQSTATGWRCSLRLRVHRRPISLRQFERDADAEIEISGFGRKSIELKQDIARNQLASLSKRSSVSGSISLSESSRILNIRRWCGRKSWPTS